MKYRYFFIAHNNDAFNCIFNSWYSNSAIFWNAGFSSPDLEEADRAVAEDEVGFDDMSNEVGVADDNVDIDFWGSRGLNPSTTTDELLVVVTIANIATAHVATRLLEVEDEIIFSRCGSW